MSGDAERPVDESAASAAQEPAGGERLAAARREKKVSVVQIAKELHLDEEKVRALERNEFESLGAPVFAKGHLRKYAELVGVDIKDVLTEYYQLTRAEGMPPIVSGRPRLRRELAPGPWIVVVVLLVAAAGVYWWFGVREPVAPVPERSAAPAPAADEPAVPERDTATGPAAAAPADTSAAPAAETLAGDSALPTVPAGPPARPAESRAADGRLRLSMRFSGDCWTEITDATGRRLFFGMGRDGQTVDLAGAAPVAVLFGNGANVSLTVDGEDYELPALTRPNQPVRLTLGQDR